MTTLPRLLAAIFLLASALNIKGQQTGGIIINEFLASNNSTIRDPEFGEYSDWIELLNTGEADIYLEGWFLSDDPDNPAKWPVKPTVIKPGQFRGFWADGQDFEWHTNFLLAKEGGFIGLYDADTTVIDSVIYPEQRGNISYGRLAGEYSAWFYFDEPTPARINSDRIFYGFSSKPELLIPGGFFTDAVSVEIISHDEKGDIHYTTDGSHPDKNSPVYTSPVTIDSTSVLKAVIIKEGFLPDQPVSNSYFINETTELPVFSLSTDPKNFFDDRIGIYVEGINGIAGLCSETPKNWNQDWERPVNIEFYEADKTLVLKQDAGIKISGGCSRIYPQKSLAIWARNEYGENRFGYRFFPDREVEEYKSLVLRTSAQDWWRTMFRDGMIHSLFKGCLDIDYQDYRPAVVFLNGEYYGIHNIREKLNEHYIEENFGVELGNLDLIEISKNVRVKKGDGIAYNHLIGFIESSDLSDADNYEYVKTLMDIDEYIDYVIAELYVANGDWPGNNIKAWRQKSPAGKFRWMIFDLDFGFGGNSMGTYSYNSLASATNPNGPDWPNPPWATLMLRRLLASDQFRNEFIQRFAYHVNTTFSPDRVLQIIETLQSNIAAEIPRHKERWVKSISFTDTWDEGVEIMREFARKRPFFVKRHFSDKFNLGGTAELTLKVNEGKGGYITAFNKILTDTSFAAEFFKNVPIAITAKAKPGYRFAGWSGIQAGEGNKVDIVLNYNYTVTANFVPDSGLAIAPQFNEINYNSSPEFDVEDWVEIHNPTEETVDLSGWIFKDSVNTHSYEIADNIILEPDSYIVLSRDTAAFRTHFPEVDNVQGNFDFGLSNGGEYIRLYDNLGLLVDSVRYMDEEPWPIEPDGTGATLSLISKDLDNTLPTSWFASYPYGTPGRSNDVVNPVTHDNLDLPDEFALHQNYPNPFNPSTTIKYSLPRRSEAKTGIPAQSIQYSVFGKQKISQSTNQPINQSRNIVVSLKVYDLLGREVAILVNERQQPGRYEVHFDASSLSSGIYFYSLRAGSFTASKKMILLK